MAALETWGTLGQGGPSGPQGPWGALGALGALDRGVQRPPRAQGPWAALAARGPLDQGVQRPPRCSGLGAWGTRDPPAQGPPGPTGRSMAPGDFQSKKKDFPSREPIGPSTGKNVSH